MFKFIRRLFGRADSNNGVTPPPSGLVRASESLPVSDALTNPALVHRAVVLNRAQHIAGYQFVLPGKVIGRLEGRTPGLRRAYDDGLIRNLGLPGMQALLASRLVFIGLSFRSLANPQLCSLSAANTVLMLDLADATAAELQQLPRQVQAARTLGFQVGYPLSPNTAIEAVPPVFDLIQIPTPAYDGIEIADTVRRLHKLRTSAAPCAIIATEIESSDDFYLCLRANVDYFQGPFLERGESLAPPRGNVDRTLITRVLSQLRSGAEGRELAATIGQDAVVTYKLLRYINSPANGLVSEIDSIEQCLLLLGRERFYRWLSLLLFDVQSASYIERVVTEKAMVRASLMERVGRRSGIAEANPDHLFLTGLFSLLGTLLHQPLGEILASISVPLTVEAALLHAAGPLVPFLSLAVAVENGALAAISDGAVACRIDEATLNALSFEALAWANAIGDVEGQPGT